MLCVIMNTMNIFEKRPRLFKFSFWLIVIYLLITIISMKMFEWSTGTNTGDFLFYKHIGLTGFNLLLVKSKNKIISRISLLWFIYTSYTFFIVIEEITSSDSLELGLFDFFDLARSILFITATLFMVYICLYNYYLNQDKAAEDST